MSDDQVRSFGPSSRVARTFVALCVRGASGRTNLIVFEHATPIALRAFDRKRFHVIVEAAIEHDLGEMKRRDPWSEREATTVETDLCFGSFLLTLGTPHGITANEKGVSERCLEMGGVLGYPSAASTHDRHTRSPQSS